MRIVDDEDDSMAANPEAPRIAQGYQTTTEPRRKDKPGYWDVVWRDAKPANDARPVKQCRGCKEPTAILHSIAPEIRREYCGTCQGRSHL